MVALLLVQGEASLAHAGMTAITLSDVARMRLQTMSFFLLGLLGSAWFIQLLWNYLRRDFAVLPRISYGKAVGVVVLWGLLFLLVLTMISGARELMTPGAWEKQGLTYRPAQAGTPVATNEGTRDGEREYKLEQLRQARWDYAQVHDGQFPPHRGHPGVPADAWLLPDPSGVSYLYVPGLRADVGASPLVIEPELLGSRRLVLFTNGRIRALSNAEIAQLHIAEKRL